MRYIWGWAVKVQMKIQIKKNKLQLIYYLAIYPCH
jgi:hypothetical protein